MKLQNVSKLVLKDDKTKNPFPTSRANNPDSINFEINGIQ